MQVGVSSFTGYSGCGSGEPSAAVNAAVYAGWIEQGIEVRRYFMLAWFVPAAAVFPEVGAVDSAKHSGQPLRDGCNVDC